MFFSLKWKAVSLSLIILLMLCGFLVFLNASQMQSLAKQQQHHNFIDLSNQLNGLLLQSYRQSVQLIDLIPSLDSKTDSRSLITTLEKNWSTLQLNWGIESAALYNTEGVTIWATNNISHPKIINTSSIPDWTIDCTNTCRQTINSPIIDTNGNPFHLQLEVSMADMLIDFNLIANTDIGVLIKQTDNTGASVTNLNQWKKTVKLITTPPESLPILKKLESSVAYHEAIDNNNKVEIGVNTYEVSITTLPNIADNIQFVIIVDTTASTNLMDQSNLFHLNVVTTGIGASCILLLLFLWKPIKRLRKQADLLPLLITGELSEALEKLKDNRSKHWLKDEIDLLNETEEEVCQKLNEMRQDIDRKSMHLHTMAMFDSLTNLANRRAFMEHLDDAINRENLESNPFSLLFIDLDNFKRINDSMGHNTGDELLKIVSQRLHACVRSSDIIARLGGDEFCIILNSIKNNDDSTVIAEHILERLRVPIKLRNTELTISASIGIVSAPQDGETGEELLQNADLAMYKAKALGRDKYQKFDRMMTDQAVEQMALESELRRAIRSQEFVLYYQPQIDFKDNSIFGFEALIRWQHPEKGILFPDTFISLLEETGLITPLGNWIIDEACRQLSEWIKQGAKPVRIAINISPRQLQSRDLASQVKAALLKYQLSPSLVELEITESMIMENIKLTQTQLSSLQNLGITVAIDDFGTGHSSLSYLKSLPLDILKIDRAFIKDLTRGNDDQEIVSAIIAMAHKLHLKVVAEGVETEDHQNILKSNDCDYGQGYLYSRPVPADEAFKLINPSLKKTTPPKAITGP